MCRRKQKILKPEVGMIVCNCQYKHLKIVQIWEDEDTIRLEDGSMCSFYHCCDLVPHEWEHPNNK